MEHLIRKRYLNAVPVLSLVIIVLISVFGDNYSSITLWTQFIIFGLLMLLNVAALAIRYRRNKAGMIPRLVILVGFLMLAAALTLFGMLT